MTSKEKPKGRSAKTVIKKEKTIDKILRIKEELKSNKPIAKPEKKPKAKSTPKIRNALSFEFLDPTSKYHDPSIKPGKLEKKPKARSTVNWDEFLVKPEKKPKVKKPIAKKAKPVRRDHYQEVLTEDNIRREIQKNKDCVLIEIVNENAILVKTINLSIPKTNENSVFQPHETVENRVYAVLIILSFNGSIHSSFVEELVQKGAKHFYLRTLNEIEYVLEEVN